MGHKSRLGCLVIDCRADEVAEAARFWGTALGGEVEMDEDGKYATVSEQGDMKVLVQAVDHEPRVHLDIEADDKEAEVARLEAAGATVVARIKRWIVMEAPTGHRFCVVNPQSELFAGKAKSWEG
jgi:predicted enzyme related to lactoylglutathione lyase